MSDSIIIKGLLPLLDKLNELGVTSDEAMLKAMKQGVKHVQGAAKMLCTVDTGELRNSIVTKAEKENGKIVGTVSTDKEYAAYVELGTGQRGEASPSPPKYPLQGGYRQTGWWIHEGNGDNEISRKTAEKYGMFYNDTPKGRFYYSNGAAAHPFMYPAAQNTRQTMPKVMANSLKQQIKKAVTGK